MPARADSLWKDTGSRALASDRKAAAVGDIVTILVQESSTATKDNSTSTSKSVSGDNAITTFLYSPAGSGFLTHGGQMPALKYNSANSFSGGGSIENKEQIVAKIPVRVVDVLPNNSLVIEGTRHTSFGNEQQDIILRGVVRAEDIAANNTVFSYNVADAVIKIANKGPITDTQRKGWFTKLWDVITPF
jgi:flagellar L-ring protein precursor FlgH